MPPPLVETQAVWGFDGSSTTPVTSKAHRPGPGPAQVLPASDDRSTPSREVPARTSPLDESSASALMLR